MSGNNATTVAGTKIAFSVGLPTAETQAAYQALQGWEEGGCYITNVGELGRKWNPVTSKYVCSRREKTSKGTFKWSEFPITLDRDFSDVAQAILEDAEASDDPIAVRVTLPTGHKFYFMALNMGMPLGMGDGDTTISSVVSLQPECDEFIRVDPAPANS